jgi:hypothetical protein
MEASTMEARFSDFMPKRNVAGAWHLQTPGMERPSTTSIHYETGNRILIEAR